MLMPTSFARIDPGSESESATSPSDRCCRARGASLLVLLALAACNQTVDPIQVAADCPERAERGPSEWASTPDRYLIDDFESKDLTLPKIEGRDGSWILGSDQTFAELRAEASEHCAGRGAVAGHFLGHGSSNWGANWTAVLRSDSGGRAVPYDASEYSGVSFWAASGRPDLKLTALPVGVTTMDVAWNSGMCSTCMDYYRTTISLDSSWRRFVIRFDQLAQKGNGDPLVPLRRDQLVGVIVWPNQSFDIWIDDLRFEP
jgi:hypothetical protein